MHLFAVKLSPAPVGLSGGQLDCGIDGSPSLVCDSLEHAVKRMLLSLAVHPGVESLPLATAALAILGIRAGALRVVDDVGAVGAAVGVLVPL